MGKQIKCLQFWRLLNQIQAGAKSPLTWREPGSAVGRLELNVVRGDFSSLAIFVSAALEQNARGSNHDNGQ